MSSLEIAIVVVASSAFVGHLFVAGKNSRYFALAGIALVTFVTLRQFDQSTAQRTKRMSVTRRTLFAPLLVSGLIAGYVSADVFRRARTALDLDGSVEIWLRDTLIAGGLPLVVLVVMLLSMASRRLRITVPIAVVVVFSIFLVRALSTTDRR